MATLVPGVNDLATTHPELAKEADGWDPRTLSKGSSQKKAWRCNEGHSFEAKVANRTLLGRGCPYCSGLKVLKGVNDLATTHPELAKEADGWDPTEVKTKSNKKLSWKCPLGHKYEAAVSARSDRSSGCPFCSGNRVLAGFNDLATKFPDVAKEADGWDPTTVAPGANPKLPWRCSLGHTWTAAVYSRTGGDQVGCPYCSGRLPVQGVNDLATTNPEVAKDADGWDPTTVTTSSGKKLSWRCSLGHTWKAVVSSRTSQETGCPVCTNRTVLEGFNDLATKFPELAKEADGWDPTKVNAGSNSKKAWLCSLGHSYEATVVSRTGRKSGCPFCSGNQVLPGFNDLATTHPELAGEADGWDTTTVSAGSTSQKRAWKCSRGHRWNATVANRTGLETGCPYCTNKTVLEGFNDLATKFPELATEADGWNPKQVNPSSPKKLSWRCPLGHKYVTEVRKRTERGHNCSVCANKQVLTGFNDLATRFPEVAQEADGWDPSKVLFGTAEKLNWVCEHGHRWAAVVLSRTGQGTGCPECAQGGYKTSLSGWFYLLERPGEQQLGVTNFKEARLTHHGRSGWTEVEVVGPADGKLVLNTEKKLKQWLKEKVGLVPGTHENWFTSKLEVRSLAELKAKSGVETELF